MYCIHCGARDQETVRQYHSRKNLLVMEGVKQSKWYQEESQKIFHVKITSRGTLCQYCSERTHISHRYSSETGIARIKEEE